MGHPKGINISKRGKPPYKGQDGQSVLYSEVSLYWTISYFYYIHPIPTSRHLPLSICNNKIHVSKINRGGTGTLWWTGIVPPPNFRTHRTEVTHFNYSLHLSARRLFCCFVRICFFSFFTFTSSCLDPFYTQPLQEHWESQQLCQLTPPSWESTISSLAFSLASSNNE